MAEEPYEEIDLVVDKDKFDALVAEDEKAYQEFKDSPLGKLLMADLEDGWETT